MGQQLTSLQGARRSIIRLPGVSGSVRCRSFSTAILQAIALRRGPDEEMSVLTLEKVPFCNEDEDNHRALPAVEALRSTIVIAGVSGKMKDDLFADEEVLRFIEEGVRRLRGEIHAGCDMAA